MVKNLLVFVLIFFLSGGSVLALNTEEVSLNSEEDFFHDYYDFEAFPDDFVRTSEEEWEELRKKTIELQSVYPLPAYTIYTYNQLTSKLQALANQYPALVTLSVQGKSVDNRNIWSITLGKGSKKVLVTGSLHASEWITTPVLVETIESYLKEYGQGSRVNGEPVKHILDTYSITFLPMVNPDGVTLVQQGADAFPQRKNALLAMNHPTSGSNFNRWKANIRGVDLNRNFNVRWGEPISSSLISNKPSYAFYGGPSPESEPETRVVANWIRNHKPEILLDYHSYGEYLFWYYLQTGSALERDRSIVQAMRAYSGYRMEGVNPNTLPSSTLTCFGSMVSKIPSVCVEVGNKPPRYLKMSDVPYIFSQVKYLPLIAIMNIPDYKPYIPVQSVSLISSIDTVPGAIEFLAASVSPSNASNKKVSWTSSHPDIVSVNSQGKLTVHKLGSATITVKTEDGGKSASCHVTVYPSLPRIQGSTRYLTAVEISKAGWDSAEAVILTRGDDFADGLAGIPLAYQMDAPLLLTQSNSLNSHTRNEIERLGAEKVFILGGMEAISKNVEEELSIEMKLEVERINGINRFDTAAQIARGLHSSDTAVIVYGYNFPDALSSAAYAAVNGYPILLTNQNELHANTESILQELEIKNTLVIGGQSVISDEVLKKLPDPIRIAGPDRYATSVENAKYFNANASKIYIATGLQFMDGMTGAVLAARENTGIFFVGNRVPSSVRSYLTCLQPEELVIFGGPGAVPTIVEGSLSALFQK